MAFRIIFILVFILGSTDLFAQPFSCTGDFILAISTNGLDSRFYNVSINNTQGNSISFDEFSTQPGPYLNAIGYRRFENYVYGIAPITKDLYRIDASGNTTFLHHFDEFDDTKSYNAGDISIDGRYLVLLSGISTSLPWRNDELVLIDLESPDYTTTVLPLTTISGGVVYSLDIAFHPITGELYGYDGLAGRLFKIQLFNGEADDVSFPATGVINSMAALFFDAFGNLYGYAQHLGEPGIKAFYQIDILNGDLDFKLEGPNASGTDGCSCPYGMELLKSVEPRITTACSEVEYTFVIANTSDFLQSSVNFMDEFPSGFEILAVSGNTYNGQVNGVNSTSLSITNMNITPGIDSFKVRIGIGEVPPDFYANQAKLTNLSLSLGEVEVSDDPSTIAIDDSTSLEVFSYAEEGEINHFFELCPGEFLTLDAALVNGIYDYLWDNGSTDPAIVITEGGTYKVVASNECELLTVIFTIAEISPGFSMELGGNQIISLGESISLLPIISNGIGLIYNWSSYNGQYLECDNCSTQSFLPFESDHYFLTVTDANGCSLSDSMEVIVNQAYNIYVPNVFTPNGDGINDLLFINGINGTMVTYFRIYNRWGGLVFEAKDFPANESAFGWDGYIKGKEIPSGVFIWIAKVRFVDGEVRRFQGDVTVLSDKR
ncbi:MAG: gliding motility-associated-like protein [Saprospiraceae bacterium]|jgi:gliding motility-associated-like protein